MTIKKMLKDEDALATFCCNWCMPMGWMTFGSMLMTANGLLTGLIGKMYLLCLGV